MAVYKYNLEYYVTPPPEAGANASGRHSCLCTNPSAFDFHLSFLEEATTASLTIYKTDSPGDTDVERIINGPLAVINYIRGLS